MKILYISNQYVRNDGVGNPIVSTMVQSISQLNNKVDTIDFLPFFLPNILNVLKKRGKYDIVHIHFGGMYALFVIFLFTFSKEKVILTFHGTEIHAGAFNSTRNFILKGKIKINQYASFLSILLIDKAGFVSPTLLECLPKSILRFCRKKLFIHKLGVDYELFKICSKSESQTELNLQNKRYLLFSDISNTPIKRRDIAQNIVNILGSDYEMLIMSNVRKELVPLYINSCDCLLLTSDAEGSPNIVRECLALNKPVYSVDVGDVKQQITGLNNSCIIERDPFLAVNEILKRINNARENSRELKREQIDSRILANNIVELYSTLLI